MPAVANASCRANIAVSYPPLPAPDRPAQEVVDKDAALVGRAGPMPYKSFIFYT
jgi:hypothetical protein